MIDSHCHLADPRLFEQMDAVLERAAAAGVTNIIAVGTRLADSQRCVDLAHQYPQVRAVVGCHPHEAGKVAIEEVQAIAALAADRRVVAVGELGLDYHYDFGPRQAQRELLLAQLAILAPLRKPLMIHCREATDDCLEALRAGAPGARGVFHCFTGSAAEARKIVAAGYHLSFTGIITFKSPGELKTVVCEAPADRYLVETDAPWLSPEPMRRQKINEPSLLPHTLAKLAEWRGISVEEADRQTTANARSLFGL
jgi:TatD DNase family protein